MDNQEEVKDAQNKKSLHREIRSRTIGYIVGALGLVAGLAWNEAIRGLIEIIFPLGKDSIWAKFIYAVIVTTVIVWVSVYLVKLNEREK
jgi:hypothetical protein